MKKNLISPIQLHRQRAGLSEREQTISMQRKLLDIHEKFLRGISALDDIIKKKVGPKGDRGPKGDPGPKGERGPAHHSISEIVAEVQKYIQIKTPKDGLPGATPIKGIHYFTPEDISEIAEYTSRLVKIPQDVTIDPMKILDLISNLPEGKKIPGRFIDGFEQTERAIREQTRRGYLHGAGITELTAGSNIVLSKDSNGNYIIASTGGGGSGYQTPLSGALSGTNTWATAPNVIVVDGVPLQKTRTDGTPNWTGTTTTVLTVKPTYDVFSTA